MKKQTKIILWIIGILILLGIGYFALINLFTAPIQHLGSEEVQKAEELSQKMLNDYCEVQTINGTAVCLPEGVCEFQEGLEGRKICLAKRV